ncbi:unnamed protein product [Polarella glacialis]|uniref:LAGLIDADG endonuclease n=1 Tax=Polarella glacialis TaxID=89957 RepID=A0A813DAJ4_POLGL|nr:unnamed protein product [Polarella glacialis]
MPGWLFRRRWLCHSGVEKKWLQATGWPGLSPSRRLGTLPCCFWWWHLCKLSGKGGSEAMRELDRVWTRRQSSRASLLAQWPAMKTAQLQIAAAWPQCSQLRMVEFSKLKHCKQHSYEPDGLSCSWAYIAGFFDAEGCIAISPHSIAIALTMTQCNRVILDRIHAFLEAEQPGVWRPVGKFGPAHRLTCSLSAGSREALQKMLSSGLVVKRQEAQVALTLDKINHLEVREGLAKLSGNQSCYLRLDGAGVLRATNIKRAAIQLTQLPFASPKASFLQRQLQDLRQEHRHQHLVLKASVLRQDIRSLLKQGACLEQRQK